MVNPIAAAICRDIASMAADGAQHTADPYNVERFEYLLNLASAVTAGLIEYARLTHFDLNPEAAATGAEVAIRDHRGRLLVIQRSDTGQWAMPGGACEVDESWAQTAAREAHEEIGLELDPAALRLVDVFDNRAITAEKTTIPVIAVFSADIDDDSALNTSSREVDDTAWVDADELKKLDLFPGHHAKATAALDYALDRGDGMPIATVAK